MVKKGEWWLVLVWRLPRQRRGCVWAGKWESAFFGAAPPVAGALLIFFFSFYWVP